MNAVTKTPDRRFSQCLRVMFTVKQADNGNIRLMTVVMIVQCIQSLGSRLHSMHSSVASTPYLARPAHDPANLITVCY